MRFGSVCSGIEAASVAWGPLGWDAAWFSEVAKFPSAVLAHHYPDVPNYGDMTDLPKRILSGEVEAPGLLAGGTPCQAFSVAGQRNSLDDARGNLSLIFCEIANAIDSVRKQRGEPGAIIFWENVPGCRNTKDNFFGCFLAELCGATEPLEIEKGKWPTSGLVVGERRRVAWATLDARWFGLAQRRKRVFVVAYDNALVEHFGMPCPSEILSLGNGLPRNSPQSGKTGQGIAADAESGAWWDGGQVAATLTVEGAGGNQRMPDKGNLGAVVVPHPMTPPHVFKIRGGCEGGGKGYLGQDEQDFTITTGHNQQVAVAIGAFGKTFADTVTSKFAKGAELLQQGAQNGGNCVLQPVGPSFATQYSIAPTLTASNNPSRSPQSSEVTNQVAAVFAASYAVRRLTPIECERLQGFPDNYTNIPWRNKPEAPDGPRYKALGNSWAVLVVRWIGERINNAVNRL